MKKRNLLVGLLVCILLVGIYVKRIYHAPSRKISNAKKEVQLLIRDKQIHDGDLIFQTSLSRQSIAIQKASKSVYSHCGLVFKNGDNYEVIEAVQPVKKTPLYKWIAKGKNGHYVIKRLKNASNILTPDILSKIKSNSESFLGKNYDLTFEWSDDKIYCSELIWKAYQRATGIEIGKLQKLKDFDLTDESVKTKMKERYGDNIPYDEIVISPGAIYESELLETIKSN